MIKHSTCNLVYVLEVKNQNPIEEIKENIKYYEQAIYNSKFFENLNRDIELGLSIRIRLNYLNKNLRYVDIDNTRYKIERSTNLKGHYALLDLSELI